MSNMAPFSTTVATQIFPKLSIALVAGLVALSRAAPNPTSSLEIRDDNLPARVPYVFPAPGTDPIADAIRSRRANMTLLDLDGALLNAPLIAQGWNSFFDAIRDKNSLPGEMRELFILRSAVLNNAAYQWIQHESVGRSEGLTAKQLLAIRTTPPFLQSDKLATILGPSLTAAMTFTDWITKNIHVPDNVFNSLRKFLNNQQMVEATTTAAAYNLISRFVIALNVDDKMNVPVPIPH
ncbi:AhpD-like protein [Crucibulum laeve]|uniref:AhpD-like protein n=1 Tax=Crucibulum laeve TaxID=68775 RepID=A0A5C3ML10_9AGAR|nr:AhpD-like protein [Crucibulum laeve]